MTRKRLPFEKFAAFPLGGLRGCTPVDQCVYAVLMYEWTRSDDDDVELAIDDLARQAGVAIRSIPISIKRLVQHGHVVAVAKGGGRGHLPRFRLVFAKGAEAASFRSAERVQEPPPSDHERVQIPSKNRPLSDTETVQEPPPSDAAAPSDAPLSARVRAHAQIKTGTEGGDSDARAREPLPADSVDPDRAEPEVAVGADIEIDEMRFDEPQGAVEDEPSFEPGAALADERQTRDLAMLAAELYAERFLRERKVRWPAPLLGVLRDPAGRHANTYPAARAIVLFGEWLAQQRHAHELAAVVLDRFFENEHAASRGFPWTFLGAAPTEYVPASWASALRRLDRPPRDSVDPHEVARQRSIAQVAPPTKVRDDGAAVGREVVG